MTIEKIIKNNLCTGCGICISEDKSGSSYMEWNDDGFLTPKVTAQSHVGDMERVCPFNLENKYDEDFLAKEFIKGYRHSDSSLGVYNSLYVGYSSRYRETSSSGGIATYVFEKLLCSNSVDFLFIVKEINGRYGYQLFSSIDDIKTISKTRYYPVTLESLFTEIEKIDGRVAVSGVACFIKAIRLKQKLHPELREKIPFLVGIICGGLKSKYYTDFLAQSAGCESEYSHPEYRVKNRESYASDYKFSCEGKYSNRIHVVEMQRLGDMWGTGLFKSNACDFCDDVTTELADISLGDAWIKPYSLDGLGNSIVIARSELAAQIIAKGIDNGDLKLDALDIDRTKASQQGSFNHRHKGLLYRVNHARKNNLYFPKRRQRFLVKQSMFFDLVQKERLITRAKSIQFWKETKEIVSFNERLQPYLVRLNQKTSINHKYIRIKDKFKNFFWGNK
ncbi:Coenzyme F420 hydrogenase/dehydrogenase, beta subunit C-terminal domain [Serratia marcescens]|uniref:Coenzyme F420 hydrogenase/dehydrogenase, beta subunit C-terminal domain n=1 Tax=Serratia marcescens TaxID=615 RepID=UPI000669705F|nr:Coenzyme F420 hydrogenase/dehydrogenase, beta subunit C-terminal domain [Serratia marcescens]